MPHVSDVRSTSHDRHDPMLVAALAADDLAGAERDQAIALTRTCADCATLHDDLLALARATASAPPPIATRPRDFRLTPADAARLRPSGWRRFVAALSTSRSAVARPLGVGLATIGLAGLLIGNVSLNLGSAASAPGAGSAAATSESTTDRNAVTDFGTAKGASSAPSSARTAAGAPAASAAAASAAPTYDPRSQGGTGPSGLPGSQSAALAPIPAASAGTTATGEGVPADLSGNGAPANDAFRPQNLLFGLAIVVGLGLLVASRRRGRRTI